MARLQFERTYSYVVNHLLFDYLEGTSRVFSSACRWVQAAIMRVCTYRLNCAVVEGAAKLLLKDVETEASKAFFAPKDPQCSFPTDEIINLKNMGEYVDIANEHSKQMGDHLSTMPSVQEKNSNPMHNPSSSGKKPYSKKKRQRKQKVNTNKRNKNGGKSLNFGENEPPITPESSDKGKNQSTESDNNKNNSGRKLNEETLLPHDFSPTDLRWNEDYPTTPPYQSHRKHKGWGYYDPIEKPVYSPAPPLIGQFYGKGARGTFRGGRGFHPGRGRHDYRGQRTFRGRHQGHQGRHPGHQGRHPGHHGMHPGHLRGHPGHQGRHSGHEGRHPGHQGRVRGRGNYPSVPARPQGNSIKIGGFHNFSSSFVPNQATKELLSKGLKFIPTPLICKDLEVLEDFKDFRRRSNVLQYVHECPPPRTTSSQIHMEIF